MADARIKTESPSRAGRPSLAGKDHELLLSVMLLLVEGRAATVREATLQIAALDGDRVATVVSRAKRLERAFWAYVKKHNIAKYCRNPHVRRILTPRR
jgi:hypothetical protein